MKNKLYLFLAMLLYGSLCYASDTLTVQGKIENFTIRLYRKAPQIAVSRINILSNEQEIIKFADIQPDGSFQLKLPLIYQQEECFLNYAAIAIPFLGSNGTVEVTIWGDSLSKSTLPLKFDGLYATTNQRYAKFYTALNQRIKEDKSLLPNLKNREILSEWANIEKIEQRKLDFYENLQTAQPKDELLDKWVKQSLSEQTKAFFMRLLQERMQNIPPILVEKLQFDTTSLLTFAKADFHGSFASFIYNTPLASQTDVRTLPVNTLAKLLLKYVPQIDSTQRKRLEAFQAGKTAILRDMKWINTLFEKNKDTLNILSGYEIFMKIVRTQFDYRFIDYLKGVYYSNNAHLMLYPYLNISYNHILPEISNPFYAKSLTELHQLASKDATLLQKIARTIFTSNPSDVLQYIRLDELPNTEITIPKENVDADDLMKLITKPADVPKYIIFLTTDKYGLQALTAARAMQKQVGNSLKFIFVCDAESSAELWKEYIVKTKAEGWHLKLMNSWTNSAFVDTWQIDRVPFAILIDTKGKYISRHAPLPNDQEGWTKIWDKVFKP